MEEHAKLIDSLGGNVEVSRALLVSNKAVSNWRERGIPWRLRPAVADLAGKRGVALPSDFFSAAAKKAAE